MARAGVSIDNPLTGERMTWVQTAADTGGELLCFDLHLQAGAAVSAEHWHPRQTEHFVVISGSLRVTVDGRDSELQPEDEMTVAAGTPHHPSA